MIKPETILVIYSQLIVQSSQFNSIILLIFILGPLKSDRHKNIKNVIDVDSIALTVVTAITIPLISDRNLNGEKAYKSDF